MESNNSSFIQIPLDLTDIEQLRRFFYSLLEKLNELEGNIGQDGAIKLNIYNTDKTTITEDINTNKTNISNIQSKLPTFSKLDGSRNYTAEVKYNSSVVISDNYSLTYKKYVDDNFTYNPIQSNIATLNQTTVTRGSSYDQTEAQTVADNLEDVANKVDEIINALQAANIIT